VILGLVWLGRRSGRNAIVATPMHHADVLAGAGALRALLLE
jgi:hypothetical protein